MNFKKLTTLFTLIVAATFISGCSGDPKLSHLKKLKKADESTITQLTTDAATCAHAAGVMVRNFEDGSYLSQGTHFFNLMLQPALLFDVFTEDLPEDQIIDSINHYSCNYNDFGDKHKKALSKLPECKSSKNADKEVVEYLRKTLRSSSSLPYVKEYEIDGALRNLDGKKDFKKYLSKNCKI